MIRIFLPLLCAALGFATASCSQTESPLAPAEAPASPGASSHGAAAAAMADPFASASPIPQEPSAASAADASPTSPPAGAAVERRASTLIGIPVVSADGSPLGRVTDIIFDRQGRATHLVIAYGAQPQAAPAEIPEDGKPSAPAAGRLTAIPWDAAIASLEGGRLVLAAATLERAPSFTPDAWPSLTEADWSAATDAYWRKAVRAEIAAHPTPIDPTSRSRSRQRGGG